MKFKVSGDSTGWTELKLKDTDGERLHVTYCGRDDKTDANVMIQLYEKGPDEGRIFAMSRKRARKFARAILKETA